MKKDPLDAMPIREQCELLLALFEDAEICILRAMEVNNKIANATDYLLPDEKQILADTWKCLQKLENLICRTTHKDVKDGQGH